MLSLPIQLVQLHDPGGEGGGVRGTGGMSGSQAFSGHIVIKNDPDGTRTLLLDPSEVGVGSGGFIVKFDLYVLQVWCNLGWVNSHLWYYIIVIFFIIACS